MLDGAAAMNSQLKDLLETIASKGVHRAAEGFGGMIGTELAVQQSAVKTVGLMEIPELLGGPENDAVGIYLRVTGDLPGQMMLILPYTRSLELVDMMMMEPVGTTTELGPMERSALAELGNITGSFFLNAVADLTGYAALPSPPAVMVDMVGAILDILIASWGGLHEEVLMFSATFSRHERNTEFEFWVLPDPSAFSVIADKIEGDHAQ